VSRLERDLAELARLARQRAAERDEPAREEAAVG
jgi:hypothetical protein